MIGFLAQASSDETRLLILVIGLVLIATMLTVLTVWYWRYTDPKRHMRPQDAIAGQQRSAQGDRNPRMRPKANVDAEPELSRTRIDLTEADWRPDLPSGYKQVDRIVDPVNLEQL